MTAPEKVNALGASSPRRTDFKAWARTSLEQFAREVADENLLLREDIRVLHDAWRKAVKNERQP